MRIVISAVNILEGGILSILEDCMASIKNIQDLYDLEVIVLVHNKNLIGGFCNQPNIELLEYPQIKSSWLRRLYFEFIFCRKLSRHLKPDIWLSLHDITPNVTCDFQAVYCHNSSSFYKPEKKYFFTDITFSLFNLFYKYLYRVNIKKNAFVIIQQNWLRNTFKKLYNVNTIVAYPLQAFNKTEVLPEIINTLDIDFKKTTFFFPSIPRVFKNFEVVCQAAEQMQDNSDDFEIILTLDGTENKYASLIFEKYKHVKALKFIGLQKRNVIQALYNKVDCLVFPSKLETWGLPISEFKLFNKPMLISDLPYAHETVGLYSKAKFFNPQDEEELARYMRLFIDHNLEFDENATNLPDDPFFQQWDSLLEFLITQAKKASV